MATFGDIKAKVADDLDDTTGEYAAQIEDAVLKAIRYCERETYYFNETRDVTFITVNGQEWYDETDNANIPTLVRIQCAYKEDAQGQRTTLTRVRPEDIEMVADSAASTGEPYQWTYFGQRIRLYPIPDATVFTIRLQLGPYRLAPLSGESDTNAWTEEAQDLIVARARFIVCSETLKDDKEAAKALVDYDDQRAALKRETSARNGTGFIDPTCF